MLAELHVRDLALIDEVWLELGPGFTVLSGETGAGKTVLVSALKLLLGERADSTMVRRGADEALVEGRFIIDGEDVLVRRRVSAEGRSRCMIDGEMATVTMLAELVGPSVDLHGQHEHQALLSPARHVGYLDRFIGDEAAAARRGYTDAWDAHRTAQARLESLQSTLTDREQRIDRLRFVIGDIDAAEPRPGEDAELSAMLPRLRHGERLTEAANGTWTALKDENGASEGVSRALHALASARGLDSAFDDFAETATRLDIELQELGSAILAYAETIDHDPAALDEAENRLHLIETLTRKYGGTVDAVLEARAAAVEELALLDAGEAGLAGAQAVVEEAAEALRGAGSTLVRVRDRAVDRFVESLRAAAVDLSLANASFRVERTPLPFDSWTAEGPERVEFLFSAAAGEDPRPLARIASGGEVSRVMLALKSVLGDADSVPVLVFDEVDAGIGGATARAVGARLSELGTRHQVLAITHLAQVASAADRHIVVAKREDGGRTVTSVSPVTGEDRVAEVARMLSGGASDAGVAHARELLGSIPPVAGAGG
ncbi:MAG: DNA repair protein RecN [Coriobacteriia bacterium]|nr:DNA repair protein RecN [Coriobacteriia bacterium]MBN2840625.1 DNA repair protein RecN [Coriobacteriia bacterium]